MAYPGIHVHLYHTTAAQLMPVALDPAIACRTTKDGGVLWCAPCGLLHITDLQEGRCDETLFALSGIVHGRCVTGVDAT
jgi:hypothetical protein